MTDLRKAAEMALYALEFNYPLIEDYGNKEQLDIHHEAIMALHKALVQPEQEPVAWRKKMSGVWHYFDESTPFPFDDCEPLYEKH
jgi:hypothetical protein